MIRHEDCTCIDGRHYNNADETSGQWVDCTDCDYSEELAKVETQVEDLLTEWLTRERELHAALQVMRFAKDLGVLKTDKLQARITGLMHEVINLRSHVAPLLREEDLCA